MLIFTSYYEITAYVNLRNYHINHSTTQQDNNIPILINKTNIMFSFMFEHDLLQNDF